MPFMSVRPSTAHYTLLKDWAECGEIGCEFNTTGIKQMLYVVNLTLLFLLLCPSFKPLKPRLV
jgi:hypothetical protein